MPSTPMPQSGLLYALPVLLLILICQATLGQSTSTAVGQTSLIAALDASLDESSGIAWHAGSLWTHNDSGDTPRVFQLDGDGNIQREVLISNAEHVDWEAMAHDDQHLYIADTGNNANLRSTLQIYRLSWSDLLSSDRADAELISVTYADYQSGNPRSHNFDAEGLAVRGEQLWLFSKNRGDWQTRLYAFPKTPGNYRPEPLQTLPVNALITGADIHQQSGEVVLTGTTRDFSANFVWRAPSSALGVDWDESQVVEITPADQWEAVLWDPQSSSRLLLTHENNQRGYAGLASISLPD